MNCSEIATELLKASVEAGNDEINGLDTELDQDGSDYEYFVVPLAQILDKKSNHGIHRLHPQRHLGPCSRR